MPIYTMKDVEPASSDQFDGLIRNMQAYNDGQQRYETGMSQAIAASQNPFVTQWLQDRMQNGMDSTVDAYGNVVRRNTFTEQVNDPTNQMANAQDAQAQAAWSAAMQQYKAGQLQYHNQYLADRPDADQSEMNSVGEYYNANYPPPTRVAQYNPPNSQLKYPPYSASNLKINVPAIQKQIDYMNSLPLMQKGTP